MPIIRGNSLYTIVDGPSWSTAEANSVALGGHLVAINDSAENTFLQQAYQNNSQLQRSVVSKVDVRAWIGLLPSSQGKWQWSDGTSVTYANWVDDQVKTNGVIPTPRNGLPIGQTFNINISYAPSYNGKWENGTPNPNESFKGIAETSFIRRGNSAYVLVAGKTWDEAQLNAVKLGGNLVTINDAAENDFLVKNLQWKSPINPRAGAYGYDRSVAYWIGLNDRKTEGRLEWIDGTAVSYLKNNASDARGDEDWFTLVNSGSWNDLTQSDAHWQMQYGIAEIQLPSTDLPIFFGLTSSDSLTGTANADFVDGRAGQDTLTGGGGADIFAFRYGDSLVTAPDRITDFTFGTDKISLLSNTSSKLSVPSTLSRAADNSTAISLSALVGAVFADADGQKSGNQTLGNNQAAIVVAKNPGIAGTYLIVNDGNAGFQSNSDLVINISGYSGSLPGLGSINPSTIFA